MAYVEDLHVEAIEFGQDAQLSCFGRSTFMPVCVCVCGWMSWWVWVCVCKEV